MENILEKLVPEIELCRKIKEKYPNQQASLNWYAVSGCSYSGSNVFVSESISYTVGEQGKWNEGLNYFAMRFIKEIVPAYTLQDIIELYDGKEKINSVQQLAELLVSVK